LDPQKFRILGSIFLGETDKPKPSTTNQLPVHLSSSFGSCLPNKNQFQIQLEIRINLVQIQTRPKPIYSFIHIKVACTLLSWNHIVLNTR